MRSVDEKYKAWTKSDLVSKEDKAILRKDEKYSHYMKYSFDLTE